MLYCEKFYIDYLIKMRMNCCGFCTFTLETDWKEGSK